MFSINALFWAIVIVCLQLVDSWLQVPTTWLSASSTKGFFALAPLLFTSGFLPDRASYGPGVTIPAAISKLHPLPEEELFTSYNRGNSYLVSGRFREALLEFNRALDIRVDLEDVWLSRGIVNEKLLHWDDAIGDYKEAIRLSEKKLFGKNNAEEHSNLGNALAGAGRWDEALKEFTFAASLKEDYVAPRLGQALCLYQLDRKAEALAYFDGLANLYPLFADGRAAQAVMQFEKEELQKPSEGVRQAWETALQQDSRYLDLEWVSDIRRWPPSLVDALKKLKASL